MNPRDAVLKVIKRRDVDIDDTLARVERSYLALKDKLAEYMQANRGAEALSVAAARKDMERILVDSGVYEAVGNDDTYKNYLQSAQEVYSKAYGKNFTYSKVSKKELLLLKDQQFMKFERLTSAGRDLLADTVFNMRLGSMSLAEMKAQLSDVVDSGLARYVNTWIDTARTSYSNMASTRLAADNGITRFQYVGPSDKITRDFCNVHMDEVKTLEEWDALDNDQINPVSIYRGGYNCRHILVGVPSDMESLPEGTDAPKEDTTGGDLPKNEVARIEKSKPDIPESVTLAGDIFDRISTLKEFNQYMIDTQGVPTSLSGLEVDLAKRIFRTIDDLDKRYIGNKIQRIKMQNSRKAVARVAHLITRRVRFDDSTPWTFAKVDLEISKNFPKDVKGFEKLVERNTKSGFWSRSDADKYVEKLYGHEKAHAILLPEYGIKQRYAELYTEAQKKASSEIVNLFEEYYKKASTARRDVFQEITAEMKKDPKKYSGLNSRAFDDMINDRTRIKLGDEFLSHYATKDRSADEFFAEGLSEYLYSSRPSPYAKKIGEIAEKYLKVGG